VLDLEQGALPTQAARMAVSLAVLPVIPSRCGLSCGCAAVPSHPAGCATSRLGRPGRLQDVEESSA
jgi:hypothetical protein